MVGFDPSIKDFCAAPKPTKPADTLDPLITVLDDFCPSIVESFADFDFIEEWIIENDPNEMKIEENPCLDSSDVNIIKLESSDEFWKLQVEETQKGIGDENPFVDESSTIMMERVISERIGNLGSVVEEGIKKVGLIGASDGSVLGERDQISVNSRSNGCLREDFATLDGLGEKAFDESLKIVQSDTGETRLGILGSVIKEEIVEDLVSEKLGNLGSLIEEGMGKVSLIMAAENSPVGDCDKNCLNSESNGCFHEDFAAADVSGEKESESMMMVQSVTEDMKLKVNGQEVSEVNPVTGLEKTMDIIDESHTESGELSDSSSESESDISSSASSSSSSSEEEEEEEKEEEEKDEREMDDVRDFEEGEIRDLDADEIVGGSDDDESGDVTRGPIKSKNELEILPTVPSVDVALESHHQTLPVGVILSVMGTKVIVEGLEKHNPLSEGSILWITETRLPLGLVDEIFGPVKNPYYVIRYNSDKEVPTGIHEGTPISFVKEFADHVLNDKNLYKKGYDASGENDEELSGEAEFSDDEKEAEYKRMQRMAKRGADDRKHGNQEFFDRKKALHKGGAWKKFQPPVPPAPGHVGQPSQVLNQVHAPHVAVPSGCGSCACSFGTGPGSASTPAFPSISQAMQATYCTPQHLLASSNGVWTNGMPCQQQQQFTGFSNGFPINGMPCQQPNNHHHPHQMHMGFPNRMKVQQQFDPSQMPLPNVASSCGQPNFSETNHHQHPHQMPMSFPNGMPFQQQFDPSQMILPNVGFSCGQPNFSAGSSSTPWSGFAGQGGFNQTPFGMDFQGQHANTSINVGEQGVLSNRLSGEQSCGMQPPTDIQGSFATRQKFNQGVSSTRGKKPYRRGGGGGYFAGGRGRRQYG